MIHIWKENSKIRSSFNDDLSNGNIRYKHHSKSHHHHHHKIWRKSNLQLYFNKLQFHQLSRLNKRRYIYVSYSMHTLKSLKQAMIHWFNYNHNHHQRSIVKINNIYKQNIMKKYFFIMLTIISSQVEYRMNVVSCYMLWVRNIYRKFVCKLKNMMFLSNHIYNVISKYNNNNTNKYVMINDHIILKTKLINIFNQWKDRIFKIRIKIYDKLKYKYQHQYYKYKNFVFFKNKIEKIKQMVLINEYNNYLIYSKYVKKYFFLFYKYYIYKKQITNISNYNLYHKHLRFWKSRIIMIRKFRFHKYILFRITIKLIMKYLLIWKKYTNKRTKLKFRYHLFRKKHSKYSKFHHDYNTIKLFFLSWKFEYMLVKKMIKLNFSIIRNRYHHSISLKYFHKWEEIFFNLIEKRQYLIYGFKMLYKYHLRIHSKLTYFNEIMYIHFNNNNNNDSNNIKNITTNKNKDFHIFNYNYINRSQNYNKMNHIKRLSILSLSQFISHIFNNPTNFHIKTRKNLQIFYNYCCIRSYYNQWKNIYITKKYFYLPSQYVYSNYQHVINKINQSNYLYNIIYDKYSFKKVLYNTIKSWYKLYNIYQKYHDFISRVLVMKKIFIKWIHKYNDVIIHTKYNMLIIPIIKKQQNNNNNISYCGDVNTRHYNNDDNYIYNHHNTGHKARKLIQINKGKVKFQYHKINQSHNPTTNNNDGDNKKKNIVSGLTTNRYVSSRSSSSISSSSSSSSSSYNSSILEHIEKQLRKINKSLLSEHHYHYQDHFQNSLTDKSETISMNTKRNYYTASSTTPVSVNNTTTTKTMTTGVTTSVTTTTTTTTTTTIKSGATTIAINSHKDLMIDYTALNTTIMSSLSSTTSSNIIKNKNNNHHNGYLAKYKVKMINKK